MDAGIKILIAEDDAALAVQIRCFLEKWGYTAIEAVHFDDMMKDFTAGAPQMVLMDVNLPYYDGFYWCRRIREVSDVPVIYISSRNGDFDKIMGMAQGGDDYIEKPFRLPLLRAKIEAVLRRTYEYKVKERIYLGNGLYFESASLRLLGKDKEIELTRSEKRIMAKLTEKKTEVVTREELMMELWSTDEFISDGTLTTIICRLRNKLKAACGDPVIFTKKGQGYWIP